MYTKDSYAREHLLQAGKREFLQYGFQQASLRRICKNAGVTTGAVYSCFENKEGLFCAIVGNTVEELKRMMQESFETECKDDSTTIDNDVAMMEYLYQNKDVVLILLEGAEGTRYENILSSIEDTMIDLFSGFYRHYAGCDIDRDLVTIIVKMRIRSYLEILHAGHTLEHALALAESLSLYANTGYQMLIQQARKSSV